MEPPAHLVVHPPEGHGPKGGAEEARGALFPLPGPGEEVEEEGPLGELGGGEEPSPLGVKGPLQVVQGLLLRALGKGARGRGEAFP